jgi:small-conductance mechanosensitive channel
VTLSRFGLYGLDFEVKANVADVFEAVFVASDLRYAILKAFAEKAITIPQPLGLIQPQKA